jgi:hypothetical protein
VAPQINHFGRRHGETVRNFHSLYSARLALSASYGTGR